MSLTTDSVIEPKMPDVMASLKTDVFKTLHAVKVGTIQTFDGTKKTAQIQISFKRVLQDGSVASYPILVDCPVFTLQGGGASVQLPIASGDSCLVLFSDRNLDAWFTNGGQAVPLDGRAHDLSDGIALVGLSPLNSTLPNYSTTEATMKYGGAIVGEKLGKVTIANQATTLLLALNGLITVIEGLTTTTNIGLSAASIAALEAYKLVFISLLY
jgi:hypothetical protein